MHFFHEVDVSRDGFFMDKDMKGAGDYRTISLIWIC